MGGEQSMAPLIFHRQRQVAPKCPHCHEVVQENEPRLFVGERPFHRNCWVREIIGPIESRTLGMTARQEANAAVKAWENKHGPYNRAGHEVTCPYCEADLEI